MLQETLGSELGMPSNRKSWEQNKAWHALRKPAGKSEARHALGNPGSGESRGLLTISRATPCNFKDLFFNYSNGEVLLNVDGVCGLLLLSISH
jgi:hypothetical protein